MMLSQFRIKYPQGSLISELITIDHGKYIVRALVQVNGVTLGTGLAADDTIEAAEERAKDRALESLQLDQPLIEPSQTVVSPSQLSLKETINLVETLEKTPEPVPNNSPIKNEEKTPQPSVKTNVKTSSSSEKTPSKSTKKASTTPKNSHTVESILVEEKLISTAEISPLEPELKEPEISVTEIEEKLISLTETVVEPEIEDKPLPILETPEAPQIEEEALDFSDIIARSNAELKRLKWTTDQGREYLIKTYGKRSRQVLSDEELLEFLHYLENLPTPS